MPSKPDKLELNRAQSFGPKPAKDTLTLLQDIVKVAPLEQFGEREITNLDHRANEKHKAELFLRVSHRQPRTTRSEIIAGANLHEKPEGICLHPACGRTAHDHSFCDECQAKAAAFQAFVQNLVVPEDQQIRTAPKLCTDAFTCQTGAVGVKDSVLHCRGCQLTAEWITQGFADPNYDSVDEEEREPRKRDKVLQRARSIRDWAKDRKMRKNSYKDF